MLILYLKSGKRIEVVKAKPLAAGYSLLYYRDEDGAALQIFGSEEIERFAVEPGAEDKLDGNPIPRAA